MLLRQSFGNPQVFPGMTWVFFLAVAEVLRMETCVISANKTPSCCTEFLKVDQSSYHITLW